MTTSPITSLILRVITFVLVFISFIILVTATQEYDVGKLRFNSFYAFRYTLFSMIMGAIYTLLQIAFTIYHINMGKRLAGDSLLQFDFYGDKVISYTLATGVGAAFGVAVDMHEISAGVDDFFSKIYASSSLLLFAFFCSAASSVLSSRALTN